MKYWTKTDDAHDPVAAAVRGSLAASDRSLAGAPPPEQVARAICELVCGEGGGPLVTVGNAWQALGGSLAYRFLPRWLLLWTVRKNCGL